VCHLQYSGMLNIKVFFVFFCVFSFNAFSQFPDYEALRLKLVEDIKEQKSFNTDSIFLVKSAYSYFPCAVFTVHEKELILLLQNRFVELLYTLPMNDLDLRKVQSFRIFEGKKVETCNEYFESYHDSLSRFLNNQLKDRYLDILENINHSYALFQEDKEFLNYFVYFKLYKQNEYLCEDQLKSIELSRDFENKYPDSKYKSFTKKYSRTYTESSDVGFGYRIGVGGFHNSDSFKEYFKQSISGEIGLMLNFNRVNVDFSFGYSNLRNQNEFSIYQTLYTNNRRFANSQKTALIGYRFYLGDKISFIPLIGSTHFLIHPILTDEEIENEIKVRSFNFFSFQHGFVLEFDFYNRFSCDLFNVRKIRLKDDAFSVYIKVLHTDVNFNKHEFNYIGKSFSFHTGMSFYFQSIRTRKIPSSFRTTIY
jgi:hypothetical protein